MRVIAHVLRLGHVLEVMDHLPQGLEGEAEILVVIRLVLRRKGLIEISARIDERIFLKKILFGVLQCPVGGAYAVNYIDQAAII